MVYVDSAKERDVFHESKFPILFIVMMRIIRCHAEKFGIVNIRASRGR